MSCTPYTYYLFHRPTGLKYYGARYGRNCNPSDLWTTYFTSSRYVKDLIKEYGENSFDVEIRRVFNDGSKAREWEHKVLRRLRVNKRRDWLNINYSRSGNFHGVYIRTEAQRQAISQANKGKGHKNWTSEHRQNLSKTLKRQYANGERRGGFQKGHKISATLTSDQLDELRENAAMGIYTQRDLCWMYGLKSQGSMSMILNGSRWKETTP
jgi:hypothetical protein